MVTLRGETAIRCKHRNDSDRRCELHNLHVTRHSIFGSISWCEECVDKEVRPELKVFCSVKCKYKSLKKGS